MSQKLLDSVRRFYDSEAPTYDRSRWKDPAGRRYDITQQELIHELLGDPSGKLVLEIGIGTGRIGRELLKRGATLLGVDLSRGMLLEAPNNLNSEASSWDLAVANGGRLPVRNACVDLCLCINVVAHAPNFRDILNEVGRVLKPGGTCVFNYFNARSVLFPMAFMVNRRNRGVRRDVFTQWLAPSTVESLCADAGLKVSGRRGQTHVPPTVPRPVKWAQAVVDPPFRRSMLSAIAPHHIIAARSE